MTVKHLLLLLFTLLPLAGVAQTLGNLDTADAATLARDREGIGESKARAIVEHRTRNGAFRSVDELALVKGIGPKTLERNRLRLRVGPAASPATGSGGAKAAVRATARQRAAGSAQVATGAGRSR
jgi:competence protein ComEA